MNDNKCGEIKFPPKYVGYWQLGGPSGLLIAIEKKPNWFHRKMIKLSFGIEWKDIE